MVEIKLELMTSEITLYCRPIHPDAQAVTRGTPYAAGMDIYSPVDCVIEPGKQVLLGSGLQIGWAGENAEQYYVQIAPRSGMCAKMSLTPMAGVIDFDYRGEVKILMYNYGEHTATIRKGDRVAQFIMKRIEMPAIVLSSALPEVDSLRKEGGFGSTGV